MLRTKLSTSYIKRTFRPLYGWTQMTPTACFLDPAWNRATPIWPGMVMTKGVGENVTLVSGTGQPPYGFAALYVGGDGIDEPLDVGLNVFAVWIMGPDAQAEILAPAFDTTQTYNDVSGTETLLAVQTTGASQGKLVPAGTTGATTEPVARLLKVASPTKLVIGGLRR